MAPSSRLNPPLRRRIALSPTVLALNTGSSSVKFALFQRPNGQLEPLCRGRIEDIGVAPRLFLDGEETEAGFLRPSTNEEEHGKLITGLLDWLETEQHCTLIAAGHRIVHGGRDFSIPVMIDAKVIDRLDDLIPLAPNHQPENLKGVSAILSARPGLPQIGCFDTGFHRTQPRLAQITALPRELTDSGIIRYGFHGLSYEYIASVMTEYAGAKAMGRVIVAHLGHGASMCAMHNGQSVSTTMGFTVLDGLVMGKRPGTLDAGILLHLLQDRKMTPDEISVLLNDQSGLLGVSGISSDMRVLSDSDDPHAKEAVDLFVYRAVREMAALIADLGGVDVIVFTAGIGENAPDIRARIIAGLEWLGAQLDTAQNAKNAPSISSEDSAIDIHVIPTDEEIVIAKSTFRLISPSVV
jgi:acetate kinase